ncbi:MAG: LysR family transcriptional regulator [Thermodesulfobacteriota bacterium]
MLPDFNRLKVFYYIYLKKSSVAAAKELHITQSAVSQHLQKLESEINAPLFTRLHRRLVPTAAGDRLFRVLKPFMDELEVGIGKIKKAQETPSGLLRIGAPVEFGKEYMPGIISSFRKKYPEVTFFLKLGDPATLLPMVGEGELDFSYVDVFSNEGQFLGELSAYSIEPFLEEEVILACSWEYYDLNLKRDHSFKHLVTKEFIEYKLNASALLNWFKYHFGKSPTQLNIVLTVDSVQAVISAIKHHLGLGVIVSHLVAQEISNNKMIPLRIPPKKVINKISLLQLRDKIPNRTEKTFQMHFRKEMSLMGISPL